MPRASLFTNFFVLKKDFHGDWWWVFGPRPGLKLFIGNPSAIHGWKSRFFYVNHAEGWDFDTRPGGPSTVPNDEGKHVLVGDKADFKKLVATGVGDRASEIAGFLEIDCLRLAGVVPSADLEEMVKPTAVEIRQSARKKRASAQEAEGEERKKRRREETSLPPRPPSAEIRREVRSTQPPVSSVGSPSAALVPESSARREKRAVAQGAVDPAHDPLDAGAGVEVRVPDVVEGSALGVESDTPPTVVVPSAEVERGTEAEPQPKSGGSEVHGLRERAERRLLEGVGLTLEEFNGLFVPDEPRAVDLRPFQDRRAFEDADLAGTLMKAVLLPKDWEETRKRPLEEAAKTVFTDLLKVVHSAAVLSEGIESANDISRRSLREYIRLYKESVRWRTTAKGWERAATERGAKLEALGQKFTASEAEVKALEASLSEVRAEASSYDSHVKELIEEKARIEADSDVRLLQKEAEIKSLTVSVKDAYSRADSAKAVLDDALKELQRVSAEAKSNSTRKDDEIAALKRGRFHRRRWRGRRRKRCQGRRGGRVWKRGAGWGRPLGTLRFQYRMSAALVMNGFGVAILSDVELSAFSRRENGRTNRMRKRKRKRGVVAIGMECEEGISGVGEMRHVTEDFGATPNSS